MHSSGIETATAELYIGAIHKLLFLLREVNKYSFQLFISHKIHFTCAFMVSPNESFFFGTF